MKKFNVDVEDVHLLHELLEVLKHIYLGEYDPGILA
jgi:hypothetical protein